MQILIIEEKEEEIGDFVGRISENIISDAEEMLAT
mgnify:CR=1 FL=1